LIRGRAGETVFPVCAPPYPHTRNDLTLLFGQLLFPSRSDLFVAVGMVGFLVVGHNTPLDAVTFVAERAGGPSYIIPSLIAAAVSY